MSGDAEYKAAAFNSIVRQLRALVPPSTVEAVRAALPPETAALVDRPPLPHLWIPAAHPIALVRTAHDRAFGGDPKRTRMISRRAVVEDMSTIYRVFIRFASPEHVIERAARVWETYWRNNGSVGVDRLSAAQVVVHFTGVRVSPPLTWEMMSASIEAVAELAGAKSVTTRVEEMRVDGASVRVGWRM